MFIGQISLNLSFIMYTFLYLPQVLHNQKQTSLEGLSQWMHLTLYLAYSLDLVYGFGQNLPWQYCAVSSAGWLLLNIQHFQFIQHFKHKKRSHIQTIFYGILASTSLFLIWGIGQTPFTNLSLNFFGYIAQISFVVAFIPQILRSMQLQSAQALNLMYILLNFCLAGLDCVSAWQLNWGWPNKIGSGCIIFLTGILLLQQRKYSKKY